MDKLEQFKEELSCIAGDVIRKFAEEAIKTMPDYFFKVAASSTGKYHPSYAFGDGGLLRHTKAAVRAAVELMRMDWWKFNEMDKDLIVTALILHDGWKHGITQSKYTQAKHPMIAVSVLSENRELYEIITAADFKIITGCIASHMGQWNYDYRTKAVILPKPETRHEKCVHLADYIASRKFLEVNFDIIVSR